jgi:DNA-binding MarR family transcriptional regulator
MVNFLNKTEVSINMENKKLGLILIGVSLILAVILIIVQLKIDSLVDSLMQLSGGSCITETGECIHEVSNVPMTIGYSILALLLALGAYLLFFEKSQKAVLSKIEEIDKKTKEEEKFSFLLKGLDDDEKKVIMAVKEQDGIEQSTLRIRTNMSKAKLSIVLSELEKKELIKKVPKGKTNRIYLKFGI